MHDLLAVRGLSRSFGGFKALSDVSLSVRSGERLGLIGPNGSGKTTLINCMAGTLAPSQGAVLFDGQDISALPPHRRTRLGIARSFQIPKPFSTMSVLDNLRIPIEYVVHRGGGHGAEIEAQAQALLAKFGLAAKAGVPAGQLSQVELRKLELARAMAARPRLLISDEAMAGLSSSEVDEVLDILDRVSAEGVAVLMIEHIMRAMMRFSQRVVCLEAGRIVAEGAPQDIVRDPRVRKAYLGE
ncbi:MAG: ABC transporter ATP-binding protein [Pseudomonadota bacterium]